MGREVEVRERRVCPTPLLMMSVPKNRHHSTGYIHHEFTANVYNSTHTTDVTYEVVM